MGESSIIAYYGQSAQRVYLSLTDTGDNRKSAPQNTHEKNEEPKGYIVTSRNHSTELCLCRLMWNEFLIIPVLYLLIYLFIQM